MAYLYQPDQSLNPQYFFHHITDTISEFWFRIPSSQLKYAKPSATLPSATNARLSVRLFIPDFPGAVKDTAILAIKITGEGTNGYITGSMEVKTDAPELIAEVNLWDMNQGTGKKTFLNTSRQHPGQREYYLLKDTAGNVLFDNYFNSSTQKVIVSRSISPVQDISVGYHLNEFPFPPPPFSQRGFVTFPFKAKEVERRVINDTVFTVDISKVGFYHIQIDSTTTEGLTLFQMGGDYPELTHEEDLLGPLRYLTSAQEFLEMRNADNTKSAVDRFWLGAGGSPERARDLIRKFYSGVTTSNKLFSSYTEGWKTDRGMVYIIFGPPDVVQKTSSGENWIYGDQKSTLSTKFMFTRLRNPFSDSDYSLMRSETFRNAWYRAVESWREGRNF